jgi:rod shape-determining protein MreC
MQLLLSIIRNYSFFLLFLFFEFLSLFILFGFNHYPNSLANRFFTSTYGLANSFSGEVFHFISLEQENKKLISENLTLRKQINLYKNLTKKYPPLDKSLINNIKYNQKFTYLYADVIRNSITNNNNYIVLNKGETQGVKTDMGVITSKGVVGIVHKTSTQFASVISLLHTKSKINARVRKNGAFGSVIWDGKDPRFVSLIDIPRYQTIKKGDMIETDGKSSVFPEGIPIGKIEQIIKNEETNDFIIKVKLFEDFNRLGITYIVNNLEKTEIDSLVQTPEKTENGFQ